MKFLQVNVHDTIRYNLLEVRMINIERIVSVHEEISNRFIGLIYRNSEAESVKVVVSGDLAGFKRAITRLEQDGLVFTSL